jgi:hypothetical protein
VTLSQREAQIVADLLYEEAVRKPHGYEELMTLPARRPPSRNFDQTLAIGAHPR